MRRHRHAASGRSGRSFSACATVIVSIVMGCIAGGSAASAQPDAVTIHLNRLDGWIAGSATPATAWCLTVAPDWVSDAEPVNERRNPNQSLSRAFCLYDLPLQGEAADRQLRRDSDDGRLFLVPIDDPLAGNLRIWFEGQQALELSPTAADILASLLLLTAQTGEMPGTVALGRVTRRGQPVDVHIGAEPQVMTEIVIPIVVDSPFDFQRAAHIVISAATYYQRLVQTRDAHRDLVADVRGLSEGMTALVDLAWSVHRQVRTAAGEAALPTAGQPSGAGDDGGASAAFLGATDVVDSLGAGLQEVEQTLQAIGADAAAPTPVERPAQPVEVAESVQTVESPEPQASWPWGLAFGLAGVLAGGAMVLGYQTLRRPAAEADGADDPAHQLALFGPKADPVEASDDHPAPGWMEPEWHDAREDEPASEPLITAPPPRETTDQRPTGTDADDALRPQAPEDAEARERKDAPLYNDSQWDHLDEIDRRVRVARMQAAFVASQVFSSIDSEMPEDEIPPNQPAAANGNALADREGDDDAPADAGSPGIDATPPRAEAVAAGEPMDDSPMGPDPSDLGEAAWHGQQQPNGAETEDETGPLGGGTERDAGDPAPPMPPAIRTRPGDLDVGDSGSGLEINSQALTRDILNSVARIIEEIGNYRLKTGEEPTKMFAALAGILGEKGQAAALRHDAESYRANAESLNEEIRLTQMMLQQVGKEIHGSIRLPEAVEQHVIPEFEKLKHQCEVLQQELDALRREEPLARRG